MDQLVSAFDYKLYFWQIKVTVEELHTSTFVTNKSPDKRTIVPMIKGTGDGPWLLLKILDLYCY